MRLLVVDDHILFREGLVSLIARQPDMQVLGEAGSVAEAVDMARLLKPDMILMDFNLPDGNGLDATRIILAEFPQVKIVFLTIYDEDERLFAAVRLGAKGYLLKNIPVAHLLASLWAVEKGEPALSPDMVARIMGEFARTPAPEPSTTGSDPLSQLTSRELEVLRELATGASNRIIADRLFISENTVRNHVHNVLEKLGLSNRREAVSLARQNGLGKK
jgi:DNA-binding NarL/FixJ family response regulator